jgi:hypothetical protein
MRTSSLFRLLCVALGLLAFAGPAVAQAPLAEKYLLEGKLAEGAKVLEARLQKAPDDDQARFGLGVVQFFQAFEHLGAGLYKHGLRTQTAFRNAPAAVKAFFPQNPTPNVATYEASRKIVQTLIDDLAAAEKTLAAVKDENVKLPLAVGKIKLDPTGQGKPVSAAFLLERRGGPRADSPEVPDLVICFDRGDVNWLRGYCHFLSWLCESALAFDGQRAFDVSAHLFFEKVETPYPFLVQDRRPLDEALAGPPAGEAPQQERNQNAARFQFVDALAFIHQLTRLPVNEPKRLEAALGHFEAGVAQGKEMWKHILAETDNDREWVPNPKQTSVVGASVTQEMVDTWLATLTETEAILQGKKLVPFWRGTDPDVGVNVRRAYLELKAFEPIEWVQGTAAQPFLEKGTLTEFADPERRGSINRAFGGMMTFVGYAFWFN